ncbi:MAG: PspA/IM30 family protein [Pseudomonadota bacterium]
MTPFRRMVTSITATFDDFVSKVENHEAIAESVVHDVRTAAAELKVELARVQRDQNRLEKERATAEQDAIQWQERALSIADSDEERALACVQRAKTAEQRAEQLAAQVAEYGGIYDRLSSDLRDVEDRLAELALKKSELASRMKRAEVMEKFERPSAERQATAFFDRWETEVTREEYRRPPVATREPIDPLKASFEAQEDAADLKARLDALKANGKP